MTKRTYCGFCLVTAAIVAASLARIMQGGESKPADSKMVEAMTPPEALPPGAKLVAITAEPASIELNQRFGYRQLILTGKLESGEQVDVTRLAELATPSEIVDVTPARLVRPKGDGSATLKFKLAEQSVDVPVSVSGFGKEPTVSFIREVQPLMTKLGCNQGLCHGTAKGKNGFKLSLRGYDPVFDHIALTDDLASRRFNRAAPEQSLMLLKPSGVVPHVGGALMKPGETSYEVLKAWISQGAKLDRDSPRVTKIDVSPKGRVIPLPGMQQQIVVSATYSNGSTRDVTAESFIESGNTEVATADTRGLITALRRGEAPVLVRYEGNYAAVTLTVMGDRTGFAWQQPPENNYIDSLVYTKLQKVKTLPSDLCNDAEFVRRVYLDLTGLLPTPNETRAFLADRRETRTKRDELIDRLVGNPEFVEHWTNKWADLLQVNGKYLGEEGAWAFRNWIRQAVATNMPYDLFAKEILTAAGSNIENPPASYFKTLRAPDAIMENTTHLFLGVRFNCNKCHDHPFERWTQNQHWQLAAFFAEVNRKADPQIGDSKIGGSAVEGALPTAEVVYDGKPTEVKHPNTNVPQQAHFPYEHADMPNADGTTLREQFAAWASSPKNEYFTRSYVNRIWSYLCGVGLIEPVDDIRAGNPPTNPELLDRLTNDFVAQGFDVQWLMKQICKSRVYQHSIVTNRWNEDDTINYSHGLARRLPAEVLYDAVFEATGTRRRLPGIPEGFRAAQQRDSAVNPSDDFLNLFGRPARESSCECERSSGVMLGQTLNLVNGPTVADAIADERNDLPKLLAAEPDDAKIVEELYVRFLCRSAKPDEIETGVTAIRSFKSDLEIAKANLDKHEQGLPDRIAKWERGLGRVIEWSPLEFVEGSSSGGAMLAKENDGSIFVTGNLTKDTYKLTLRTDMERITGLRLETLPDDRLPSKGPGRSPGGNFVVSELSVTAGPRTEGESAEPKPVKFQSVLADFSQGDYDAEEAIDGQRSNGWAIFPQVGMRHVLLLEAAEEVKHTGGTVFTVEIEQKFEDGQHALGKFRLWATSTDRPFTLTELPESVVKALSTPADQRTEEHRQALAVYLNSQDAELARLREVLHNAEQQQSKARLMGTQDLVWALINNAAFLFNR
jgi:hypothetical protein